MIALASLLFAQIVLPAGTGMSLEQRAEILGASVTSMSMSPLRLFEDADVRAAMKRVGLQAACPVATEISRATAARFRETLGPFAATAVRETIPDDRLQQLRPVSFLGSGAVIYENRIKAKFETTAAEPLARARGEAKAEIVARLAALPDFAPRPNAAPAIDPFFERAFGADPSKIWEDASHLSLACSQRRLPPGVTMEHAGETFPRSREAQ